MYGCNLQSALNIFYILLIEHTMEIQLTNDKLAQSSYRQNLLDAMAKSSIKRQQVRGFIHAGSGTSQINFMHNDQNSQLTQHLLHLKTSCSGVKTQIKNRELQQSHFRDSTMFISQAVKNIQTERYKIEQEIQKVKQVLEVVKSKKINALLGLNSYEHILDRMKKDHIRFQIKRNDLQKQLKTLQKSYKDLTNTSYDLKEFEYLSTTGLRQAKSEIGHLSDFRKTTLVNMSRVVDQREVLCKKKQARKQKSDFIKQMAAGDLQDADLIRIKKFLTVQVFLKGLLKNKIEKLKEFYQPYELAFLKIKGSTNVKDANSLKSEYRNFESSYNQKTEWVKHLQTEIQKREAQKKYYEKQLEQLKQKQMEAIQELQAQEKVNHPSTRKELLEKAEDSEVLMMSVKEWLRNQCKKMKIDTANKSEESLLKQVCCVLKTLKSAKQPKIQ